jgi:hypothetical protein
MVNEMFAIFYKHYTGEWKMYGKPTPTSPTAKQLAKVVKTVALNGQAMVQRVA